MDRPPAGSQPHKGVKCNVAKVCQFWRLAVQVPLRAVRPVPAQQGLEARHLPGEARLAQGELHSPCLRVRSGRTAQTMFLCHLSSVSPNILTFRQVFCSWNRNTWEASLISFRFIIELLLDTSILLIGILLFLLWILCMMMLKYHYVNIFLFDKLDVVVDFQNCPTPKMSKSNLLKNKVVM